jgi:LemA protein
MKTLLSVVAAVIVVGVMIAFWAIGTRNHLIDLDEVANKGWRDISVQLERRADLVPNLVATVKGYAAHEKEIFMAVAEARSKLLAAKTPAEKAATDAAMTSALGRLLAIGENYPQLKADTVFIRLQDELAGTENRIAVARKRYNDSVKAYNAAIRKFPGSLFASGLDLSRRDYYEAPADKDVTTVPTVQF